jgi:hypothetical protein
MRTIPPRRGARATISRLVAGSLVAVAVALLAGCAAVDTSKSLRIGAPILPPTDPAQVAILRQPPLRQYIRLGRVRARPRGGASAAAIEEALRRAAASMGANAVIITRDREGESGRVVEGNAVAYRQP